MLNELLDGKTCSGIGRDCCLDLLVKFVDRANGCNGTSRFIASGNDKKIIPFDLDRFALSRSTKSSSSCLNDIE